MTEADQVRDRYEVVIVGGGHGGAQAASELRKCGFSGSIALITDEPEQPYERPSLSKGYLADEVKFESLLIRPAKYWVDQSIDVITSECVVSIDPARKTVATASGRLLGYMHLVWSAGGRARNLNCDGSNLDGVHSIRNRADVDRIKAELPEVRAVVVIGGGYIGLEAASALRKLGKDVVVLEEFGRVLARVAGEPLSRFFEAEHRAHGVDVKLNAHLERILENDGRVFGAKLDDGTVLPADLIIVGIGIVPSVDPLVKAGAMGEDGVDVDRQCRASLDNVFAIGDCANHSNRYAGGARVRLECVQNACDQAEVVAKAITGSSDGYDAVPRFWSDQFDLRLQTVGLFHEFDRCVVRGEVEKRSFSLVYLKDKRVIALDCVNATRDFVQGKKLVMEGARIPEDQLADLKIPLR